MWDYHGDWGWGSWLIMATGMVAFWLLVAWAIFAIARGGSNHREGDRRPMDILADRFARGEIDESEYRSRLAALRDGPRDHHSEPVGGARSR